MSQSTGGRWIFSSLLGPIVLGINNGFAPVFPYPQERAFNIEVYTGPFDEANEAKGSEAHRQTRAVSLDESHNHPCHNATNYKRPGTDPMAGARSAMC